MKDSFLLLDVLIKALGLTPSEQFQEKLAKYCTNQSEKDLDVFDSEVACLVLAYDTRHMVWEIRILSPYVCIDAGEQLYGWADEKAEVIIANSHNPVWPDMANQVYAFMLLDQNEQTT